MAPIPAVPAELFISLSGDSEAGRETEVGGGGGGGGQTVGKGGRRRVAFLRSV